MATELMLPEGLAPSNLHLAPSVKARFVEFDVFDIAERIRREVDGGERLHVWELRDGEDPQKQRWLVTEKCIDGQERFVTKTDELDARLIEHLNYILRVPFHVRVAALEAANDEWERQQHEDMLDRMYEKFGGQMRWDLYNCGFIHSVPGVSKPARGIKPTRS